MLAINTNVASLNATRHLMKSTNNLSRTFERLSSGLRINSARDDAAGLSISTRMTSQIRGLNMAVRNTNDAISLVQVAEGALGETTNALQRIRELAIQANNATMTDGDRNDLQKEVTQLMAEIERISTTTEFNNLNVLNGSFVSENFQVGADVGQTIQVTIKDARTSALGLSLAGVGGVSIGSGAAAVGSIDGALNRVDAALSSISDVRSQLGAYQNRFESIVANLSNISENTSAARSRILDADIAAETANLTKNAIMQQAGTAILAQANQQPQIALQLLG
ncbi:MAG: flagellin FliC [Magnetococcales bacterium]|nr:flagellin FliC [Magnetococcales bacterium]